jgi:hypothetical protein
MPVVAVAWPSLAEPIKGGWNRWADMVSAGSSAGFPKLTLFLARQSAATAPADPPTTLPARRRVVCD